MLYKDLSPEQMNAVTGIGNILLTACPGSGKTRVIVHKIAHELETLQTNKTKLVVVTFTNRASDEIVRRINKMGLDTSRVWAGTIHSFCLEWIIKPYSLFHDELKNGFSIADEADLSSLLIQLKSKFGFNLIDSIDLTYSRSGEFNERHVLKRKLISEYREALATKRLIDFNMLLYFSYDLVNRFSKISSTLSGMISSIFVDEFQDTQDLQYGIIGKIIRCGNGRTSVFFAGDVDQAIYKSLGGVAKSHDEIQSEIGLPLQRMELSGNYRSNQRIVNFYKNFQTNHLPILSLGKNQNYPGTITLRRIPQKNLVDELVRLITAHLNKGIPENEICILVPQWWLVTSITRELRSNVPDINFDASGLSPMSKNRDNIWYKISRMLLTGPSPNLHSARRRWSLEILNELEEFTQTDFFESDNKIRVFLRLINSVSSNEKDGIKYLKDCLSQITDKLGIDTSKYPSLDEKWEHYFQTLESRVKDAKFNVPSDIDSFKSFYRESKGVVINTCVGVKGEEFEVVIAYGLLKGYLPHWNEIFESSDYGRDASMKLLYVICSRAKNHLHLIAEEGRYTKSNNLYEMNDTLKNVIFNYDQF